MKINKKMIKREIAGDFFLVPAGDTVLEYNGLFAMNELAAFIWDALPDVDNETKITERVLKEYEIERATAEKDIAEFLEKLREYGIID